MDCRISPRLACSVEDRWDTGFTVGSGGGAFLVGGGGGGGTRYDNEIVGNGGNGICIIQYYIEI